MVVGSYIMGNVEKVHRAADDLFVLPSMRGLNPEDPGFDPEEFLDKFLLRRFNSTLLVQGY